MQEFRFDGVVFQIDDALEVINVTTLCDKGQVFRVVQRPASPPPARSELAVMVEEIRLFADRLASRLQSAGSPKAEPDFPAAAYDTTRSPSWPQNREALRGFWCSEAPARHCRPAHGAHDAQSGESVRSPAE